MRGAQVSQHEKGAGGSCATRASALYRPFSVPVCVFVVVGGDAKVVVESIPVQRLCVCWGGGGRPRSCLSDGKVDN
jgi:hypothetical protein